MQREIAERFAATAVEGMSLPDAQKLIAEFLRMISRCPVCNGTGTIKYEWPVAIDVMDRSRSGSSESRTVMAGTESRCIRCGGLTEDDDLGVPGDPEFVAWHCNDDEGRISCRHRQLGNDPAHANCGYRIVLPLVDE